MASKKMKFSITRVPKPIRNNVKTLFKQAQGKFQFAVMYVDNNTRTIYAVDNARLCEVTAVQIS
jgi:hypothetical protein